MNDTVRAALFEGYSEPIRDVLWGHIYLTPALSALTEAPPFMRLHRIMQLGPALHLYPGATHTRASHSIGVYHLARRLLSQLLECGADSWLSAEGVRSFLCAALLHDLGHFPYTHSLKDLPLQAHERLTGKLITSEPVKSLVAGAGADPYLTAAIVDSSLSRDENGELLFFRRLLSGALDPDKLDYLSRDARYCGVPYGAQDVDFILSRLIPHKDRGIDIDSRGITAVESLLFSKYLMYRAVYWHKTVRAATAMVKKAVAYALQSKTIAAEELYNLDDQGLFALASRQRQALFDLVQSVRDGKLFSTAAEVPFNTQAYSVISDLAKRPFMEESLAAELSTLLGSTLRGDEVIIDLPEQISFESGLHVADEDASFSRCSSIFKDELVESLVSSLRIIRVFIHPKYREQLGCHRKKILHTIEKWLTLEVLSS